MSDFMVGEDIKGPGLMPALILMGVGFCLGVAVTLLFQAIF